jgi:uncharacterized damage-inducible protein DinB
VESTWTAPPVSRTPPPWYRGRPPAGERSALEGWLDFHRDTLASKCSGLTSAQLKERAVPPSTLSLLGLVRHMAGVERIWFRIRASGEAIPAVFCTDDNPDADFDDVAGADAAVDLATLRAEVEAARQAGHRLDLDREFAYVRRGSEVTRDVRWLYLHMIEEYARHNGHADLLRERLDGLTGE